MAIDLKTEEWRQADAIFDRLLDLPDDQRQQQLERMSLPESIRRRVRHLLDAVDVPGILDQDRFGGLQAAASSPPPDLTGREFGNYRLEFLIGHGGMSAVYRALRTDGAFDAPVALKMLKTALVSTDWLQHFRREAQFLASLRHPNIASLLDAGISDDGTPWLVTELVEGVPIDRYCQQRRLGLRERVALVLELCHAVAFAQKNLIVHRDIKPDNVLVTESGRVVLLDFGIARALDGDPTEWTRTGMTRAFTPQYAAPEQLAGEAVTTATDVFGLGGVLYKALTDTSPFAGSSHSGATRSTQRPSKRLMSSSQLTPTERRRRIQQLSGDLDNIVLKALAEEPERRYVNADAMADDLEAWLTHRPVSARKPSTGYRLGLFVRRRTALAASLAALALVAILGAAATLWQAHEARLQASQAMASEARATAVAEFLISLFEASDPDLTGIDDPRASDLLAVGAQRIEQAFSDQPELRTELLLNLARIHIKLGERDTARELVETSNALATGTPLEKAQAWLILAKLHFDAATEMTEASDAAERGLAALPDPAPLELHIELLIALAEALSRSGDNDRALRIGKEALVLLDDRQPQPSTTRLAVLVALSGFQSMASDHAAAAVTAEQAWSLIEAGLGNPTMTFSALSNYALALRNLGRLGESVQLQRQALQIVEQTYPEANRRRASMLSSLGGHLLALGEYAEAEQRMREALTALEHIYPEPNLYSAPIYNNLGNLLVYLGREAEAVEYLKVAVAVANDAFGSVDWRTLTARHNLASALSRSGLEDQGRQALLEVLEDRRRTLGHDHVSNAHTEASLAKHFLLYGSPGQALEWAEQTLDTLERSGQSTGALAMLAHSYRARALWQLDQPDAARQSFDQALTIGNGLGADAGANYLRAAAPFVAFLAETDRSDALTLIARLHQEQRLEQAAHRPEAAHILAVEQSLTSD